VVGEEVGERARVGIRLGPFSVITHSTRTSWRATAAQVPPHAPCRVWGFGC
jgi:hypothetical protein